MVQNSAIYRSHKLNITYTYIIYVYLSVFHRVFGTVAIAMVLFVAVFRFAGLGKQQTCMWHSNLASLRYSYAALISLAFNIILSDEPSALLFF